jgi:Flp pilus assembly protein TadG
MIPTLLAPIARARRLRAGRRFAGDSRGAVAVEFALLALPFFAIIAAILQTSLVFLSTQVLESAVQDASRLIRTGQAKTAGFDTARFRTEVCSRLYGLFPDCAGLHIRVSTVTNFTSATTTSPVDPNCTTNCEWTVPSGYDGGNRSDVVMVQVYYKYPILVDIGGLGLANLPQSQRLLGSTTVFKNEPF